MALFASQSFASEAVASQSFADLAIAFNKQVSEQLTNMTVSLPAGFRLQDAFQSAVARELSQDFYRKYYADEQPRTLILGINPGRHGAGLTGIPFTDSQRLESKLELPAKGIRSYEPSSTFVYEVIEKMGGAMDFYRKFFFQSPLPLCLLRKNERNNWCNANYYDRKDLTQALQPLMQWAIGELLRLPLKRGKVFCLGMSKNYQFLKSWNQRSQSFGELVPLPHPRYIVQYKSKEKEQYVRAFCEALADG